MASNNVVRPQAIRSHALQLGKLENLANRLYPRFLVCLIWVHGHRLHDCIPELYLGQKSKGRTVRISDHLGTGSWTDNGVSCFWTFTDPEAYPSEEVDDAPLNK